MQNNYIDIFSIYNIENEQIEKWNKLILSSDKKETHFLVLFSSVFEFANSQFIEFMNQNEIIHKIIGPKFLQNYILEQLGKILLPPISRICVYEMQYASQAKTLQGNTPEERFCRFIEHLSQKKSYFSLFNKYRILKKLIDNLLTDFINNTILLFERLSLDFSEILNVFMLNQEKITLQSIISSGDRHNHGNCVCILDFQVQNKIIKVVYKPRDLTIDKAFYSLISWFSNDFLLLKGYSQKIIFKSNYGWCEYIEHKACENLKEIKEFYYRMGALLCVSHLLCSTDIHSENIIAHGAYPYFIDLECTLKPIFRFKKDFAFLELQRHLVTDTLLLPGRLEFQNNNQGIDLSAIGASCYEVDSPMLKMHWERAGTDQMFLTRIPFKIEKDKNFPFLIEKNNLSQAKHTAQNIDPTHFENEITKGFYDLYYFILKNKEMLLSENSPLNDFGKTQCRVVLRNTNIYTKLLYESYHPILLHDENKRRSHFEWLRNHTNHLKHIENIEKILDLEIQDLMLGNIPYFFCIANELSLCTYHINIDNFLKISCIEYLKNHLLLFFNQQELNIQKLLIENSYIALRFTKESEIKSNKLISIQKNENYYHIKDIPEIALSLAKNSLDKIVKYAIPYEKYITWSTLDHVGVKALSSGMTQADLYSGISGLLIVFSYASKIFNEEKYGQITNKILNRIDLLISENNKEKINNNGLYTGIGGLIYALYINHKITHNDKFTNYLSLLLQWSEEFTESDSIYDVIGGSSGFIYALIQIKDLVPKDLFLSLLNKNISKVYQSFSYLDQSFLQNEKNKKMIGLGFAHGLTGIMCAIAKGNFYLKDPQLISWLKTALKYLRYHYDPKKMSWLNLNHSKHVTHFDTHTNLSWCHGAVGIGLSSLCLQNYLLDEDFTQDLNAALNLVTQNQFGELSLCHGDLGNHDLLLENALRTKTDSSIHLYNQYTDSLIFRIKEFGINFQINGTLPLPGVMCGLGGFAYQMLRMAKPNLVPSILMIDS